MPQALSSAHAAFKTHSQQLLRLNGKFLADTIYELRDGSGIGVGAPQFGPRRTIFAGLSKPW